MGHRAKSHRLGLHEQSKQEQSKRTRQTSPPKINESENIISVISNVISRTDRNSKTSASLCSRNIVNRNKGSADTCDLKYNILLHSRQGTRDPQEPFYQEDPVISNY